MKSVSSVIALITLALLPGCGSESTPGFIDTASIDCAIEVQIAIRSEPYKRGDRINEGDFRVMSSNVFPIHSTGGAGHGVMSSNGANMEVRWDRVRLQERRLDQHHSPEKRIAFDNFGFQIKNPIVLPNGTSYPNGLGHSERKRMLTTEFDSFVAATFSSEAEKKPRLFVIRARLLPEAGSAKPLIIPQTMPDVATDSAG